MGVAHTLVANEQCRRAAAVPLASDAAHALTLNKRTHTPLWSRTQAPAVSLPLKIARRLLRGCSRHFFFSLEHIVRLKGWRACRGETKKGRPHRSCAPIVRCGPPRCIGGGPNSLSACRHQKEIRNASRAVARSRAPLGASAHARHAIAPTPRAALACRALSLLSEAPGKSPPRLVHRVIRCARPARRSSAQGGSSDGSAPLQGARAARRSPFVSLQTRRTRAGLSKGPDRSQP